MGLVTEALQITYTLTFRSAFHFGTGLRNGLVHRAVTKDRNEYLFVPGSTLKGVFRDRAEQIARMFELKASEPHSNESARTEANTRDPDIIIRIFGSRFLPGGLYFDDATMLNEDKTAYFDGAPGDGLYKSRQVETRTQVSLSRTTRTAKAGHLYSSEYGIAQLRFRGQIYGFITGFQVEPGKAGTYSLLLLLASLLSVDQIGGNKSTGAGQVTAEIEKLIVAEQELSPDVILKQLPDIEFYQFEREENL